MTKKVLFVCFALLTGASYAQMTGYSHVEPITVMEHSGTQVTDYQLRVVFNTAAPVADGDMLASGADIRFSATCTGGVEFPYWIESGMNTAATVIWVKIDTLEANAGRTIYLHYGNALATPVSAIDGTFNGPNSATDSVSGGATGGVTNSQRGIRFAANEDVLVTSFGKNEPNGTTRYITLFDVATQGILRQMEISGPAGQYSYQPLAQPIWLTQGTQYILECYQGNTDGYYFGPSTAQIGQHLTYLDMRYCNGCDQNTYPQNYLNTIHYGYPDLWYYNRTNVTPAPTYAFGTFTTSLPTSLDICATDSAMWNVVINGGTAPFDVAWSGNFADASQLEQAIVVTDTVTYTVAISDACGASWADTITINAKPLPEVGIQSTATIICETEAAELSVGNGDEYTWSTGDATDSITVMPAVTTTYYVTATNIHGCSVSDSFTLVVNVPVLVTQNILQCFEVPYTIGNHTYNLPGTYIDTLAGVTSCDSIVTTNLAFADEIDADIQWVGLTLVADVGGDSYQWVDCTNNNAPIPGATQPFFEVTENGSYAVMVTVGNCSQQSACFTATTVGMEELDLVENMKVFPNPNNGVFSVQSSMTQTLRIVDATGKLVQTIDVQAGQTHTVQLANVRPGMYFLASRTKVQRLVVE